MCFSTGASFASSAVLLGVGVVALNKAQTKGQYFLAGIPLFFCIQQALEGALWIALQHPRYGYLEKPAMYGFLVFALAIWPIMVPLAILMLERDRQRKRWLSLLLGLGICIAVFTSWRLIYYPVSAAAMQYRIKYRLDFQMYNKLFNAVVYCIPSVISPFISGTRPVRWLGAVLLVSLLITGLFYNEYLISVWCYFSALLSVIALFIILHLNGQPALSAGKAWLKRLASLTSRNA